MKVMTKDELKPILKKLKFAYQRESFLAEQEALDLWLERLGDCKKEILEVAVGNYIDKNTYQPTIADIRAEYKKIVEAREHIKAQLREIYDRTRGTYPDMYLNSDDAERNTAAAEAQKAWWELVKSSPIEERVARAEQIEDATIRFVRCVEADTARQEIPTLAEFFREALRREARKREL